MVMMMRFYFFLLYFSFTRFLFVTHICILLRAFVRAAQVGGVAQWLGRWSVAGGRFSDLRLIHG